MSTYRKVTLASGNKAVYESPGATSDDDARMYGRLLITGCDGGEWWYVPGHGWKRTKHVAPYLLEVFASAREFT